MFNGQILLAQVSTSYGRRNIKHLIWLTMKDVVSILIQGSNFDVRETTPVILENIEVLP